MNNQNIRGEINGIQLSAYLGISTILTKLIGSDYLSAINPWIRDDDDEPTAEADWPIEDNTTLLPWYLVIFVQLSIGSVIGIIVKKAIFLLAKLLKSRKSRSHPNQQATMAYSDSDLDYREPDLEDLDVNETVHEENMKKAMSMLSLISTPQDTSSGHMVDTFTDEQQLNLDLPASIEQDSVELESGANLTPDSSRQAKGSGTSGASSFIALVTPNKKKVECATIESLDKPSSPKDEVKMSVRAAARLFENNITPVSVLSSRLPRPKIPTTPRQHRRSLVSPNLVQRWDTFECATPRKCAINNTPHAPINAASGDRELITSKKTMEQNEVVEDLPGEKTKEHNEQEDAESMEAKGDCSDSNWSDAENGIVSETTEWVVYND